MIAIAPLLATAMLAAAPSPAADAPVQIGQGAAALHGSLLRPGDVKVHAAVLMIGGSGPEDRDGNDLKDGQKSQALKLLALALADRGVVSLRYDKRGVGESAAAGDPQSIGQLAEDAADWARLLRREPGVRCVVLLGHSEGALVATLAAPKAKLCGLVLVSGQGRNLGDLIEAQSALVKRSPELMAQIHDAIAALRSGRPVPQVPKGYDSLFGPQAEAFTRSEISIEPAAELARVKVPVLVVQGDNDLQVSVDDARRLADAAGVKPVIVPGMNHVLKLAPKQMVGNFLTYTRADLPLAPGVAETIGDFVAARR
jgi:pimeloyl-ACP methyl ester carboxylesterase